MKRETWVSLALAAMIGVVNSIAAASFWGIYVSSRFASGLWLPEVFGSGTVAFWVALYSHDVLVNLLIAAPFAALLVLVRSLNNWACVWLAVSAGVVVTYWGAEWSNIPLLLSIPMWWAGLTIQIFSLPVAFVVVRAIRHQSSGPQAPGKAQPRTAA